MFDANGGTVTRAQWNAYGGRLNLRENYPGIQGVGFSKLIRPADLQAHIAAIRKEGYPEYAVRPQGVRQLYTSIIYLEPFSGRNLAAFGYDMMSEAVRAKAMRMAAQTGKTAISGKVKLVQETHGKTQAGFLMYTPVYKKDSPLITTQDRWNALEGFVYSPYRVDDLMGGILGKRPLKLDSFILDGNDDEGGSLMYASSTGPERFGAPRMSAMPTEGVSGIRRGRATQPGRMQRRSNVSVFMKGST